MMILKRKLKSFSKDTKKDNMKNVISGITGATLIGTGAYINKDSNNIVGRKLVEKSFKLKPGRDLVKENGKLFRKLRKHSENKKGVPVIVEGDNIYKDAVNKKKLNFNRPVASKVIDPRGGPFTKSSVDKSLRSRKILSGTKEKMEEVLKREKENGIDKNTEKKAKKYIKKIGKSLRKDKIISENSKEYIVIGKDFKDASVLSHELGHLDSERSSKRFNKVINDRKLKNITKKYGKKTSNTASILTGFTSGIKSGKKDKSSISNEIGSSSAVVAASVIPQSHTLLNESEASRRGYKMLKSKGASKKYLKYSRKKLGGALGTYAASTIPAIAMGLGSREVGRVIGKLTKKNKKKED